MKNKTWGGRFQKSLDPLAAAFNASLAVDKLLYPYDIAGSKAHASMLQAQGLLSESELNLIHQGLDAILQELKAGNLCLDATCEDIHMHIEHRLVEKIGNVGKKLHTGRSRNDQVALDLRLYCKEAIVQIIALLAAVDAVLRQLATQYANNLMPGYTHLQPAQPITLGSYWQAYQNMFSRDAERFQELLQRMDYSPLGAGALAGSSLPLDRLKVALELGFKGYIANTIDAVSDRDFVIELCSNAAICMMHLSRLAEDLILWCTEEFGFVILDDAFATGSSLMPNKKNPDIMELMRGKSGRVFGNLMAMLTLMKGLPLTYNKDMQEDKHSLFDTVGTLSACLGILPAFLQSLSFKTQHMAQRAQSGYLDATALVEQLVMQGMPFRDAHHQVGQWVAEAIEKQCSLAELMQEVHDGQ